jgi:ketol-acid reductoisomerase
MGARSLEGYSMSTIYREADATPAIRELLKTKTVAVVGYGNQGRAQALNLRDSGAQVVVGNIEDSYRARAWADGFAVLPVAEAAATADIVMLLVPDEVCAELFKKEIAPNLRAGAAVSFASGYNVAFGAVDPPGNVDCLLLAPRMIGLGVRELYERKQGFYSFVAVHRNASGHAKDVLLALAWGVGTLKKAAVEVTFKIEAELDLFNEQAFGPAFGQVLLTSIKTLLDAGYPKEAVLLELYLSGEFGYVCKHMAEVGLIRQLEDHSPASQYGAISRGVRFLGLKLAAPMKRILADIASGKFAREWAAEQRFGRLRYRLLKFFAVRQPVGKVERQVREKLGLPT